MAVSLQKIRFSLDLLHIAAIQNFYCGDEPWETEVSDWIKTDTGGVGTDMEKGCEVWLYVRDDGALVGFGSLGKSNWQWPLPESPKVPINIIPMLGVQKQYWGKPDGTPEERYSAQILDDLIHEARQRSDRHPLLALFVHPENIRAIKAYRRAGFVDFIKRYDDKATGVTYHSMIMNLSGE